MVPTVAYAFLPNLGLQRPDASAQCDRGPEGINRVPRSHRGRAGKRCTAQTECGASVSRVGGGEGRQTSGARSRRQDT